MYRYLLVRILWFVPTFLVVTMLIFFLSSQTPVDPAATRCPMLGDPRIAPTEVQACLQRQRQEMGLDKPLFPIALYSLASPDTLHRLADPRQRQAAEQLIWTYGNWPLIQAWQKRIWQWLAELPSFDALPATEAGLIRNLGRGLLLDGDPARIQYRLDTLQQLLPEVASVSALRASWQAVQGAPSRWKTYLPALHWQGWDCQYLDWLAAVIFRAESRSNRRYDAVIDRISGLLPYTAAFSGSGILLALLISIPLAVWSAQRAGQRRERVVGAVLFALDSVPAFWMALLLLLLFSTGGWLGWLPSSFRPGNLSSAILPVVAYTYGSLAFLTRTLRASLLEQWQQPYILTARALGYSPRRIFWRHALRPALLPIVTVFASVFPAMVGGSIVLERIFLIPGLSQPVMESTMDNDQPVILAVFALGAIMTLIGYLFSDLLYAWADPRIRFQSTRHE